MRKEKIILFWAVMMTVQTAHPLPLVFVNNLTENIRYFEVSPDESEMAIITQK